MLQRNIFYFLLIESSSALPVPEHALNFEKRATPLANNPGAAVVFTIAIILCLTIVIWAVRKHYQQKYTANLEAPSHADKEIPEPLRPGPPIHRIPTMQRTYRKNSDLSPDPPSVRMISRKEVPPRNGDFDMSRLPPRWPPSTYAAYNPSTVPTHPASPALPPRSYDREDIPSRFPMQEAP